MKIIPFVGGISTDKKKQSDVEVDLNDQNTKVIIDYLKQNKFKGLIIRGTIGCGKTTLINRCIEYLNFIPVNVDDFFDIETLLSEIGEKGFNKFISVNKRVYIIEDVDDMFTATEKSTLFKYISKNKCLPLIMTSNDKSVGIMREVPKLIINHIFINSDNSKELVKLNYDHRFLNCAYSNSIKDIGLDTFQTIDYCLSNDNKFVDKVKKCSLYTNSTIFYNYPKMSGPENWVKITELCCLSDIILENSFENQDWILYDAINILGTIYPLKYFDRPKKFQYPNQYNIGTGNFKEIENDIYKLMINPKEIVSEKAKKLSKLIKN